MGAADALCLLQLIVLWQLIVTCLSWMSWLKAAAHAVELWQCLACRATWKLQYERTWPC